MGKISSYGTVSSPSLSDMLIGTDVADSNATKNFTISDLFNLLSNTYGSYGSFYSNQSQIATDVDTAEAMTYNVSDLENNITIVDNSKITVQTSGVFNIQFSAQLHDTAGGSSTIDIWIAKNGTAISNTNTKIVMNSNSYNVASWNFFVEAVADDYFEIMWATSDIDLVIEAEAPGVVHPGTPSIILTVNQIG